MFSKKNKKNPALIAAMFDFIVPQKKQSKKKAFAKGAAKGAVGVGVLGAIGATVAEKRAKRPQ